MGFADLESKLDDAREGVASDGDDAEYEDYPRVKLTPEVAIGGTIVDIGFTGDTSAPQNINGADDYRDEGDFVFTLEDPEVIRGTIFEAQLRDEADDNLAKNFDDPYPFDARVPSRDFRVVPENWEDAANISESAEKVDGDWQDVGIEVYGSQFVSQPAESFDGALDEYDRIEVMQGGQAGRIMATALDATQGQSAYIADNGDKNIGLIEYPRNYGGNGYNPRGDDSYPRATMQPRLHPELAGEQVALYLHFGDMDFTEDEADEDDDDDEGDSTGYRKHYGDVLWDRGDKTVVLSQQDVLDAATDDIDERAVWLEFHEPEGGWGSDGGDSSDSDDSGGSSFDFDELDEGSADDETTLDDLGADTREFIEQAAEYAAESGGLDEAFADFDSTVENAVESGEIEAIEPDAARGYVESEMGA